MTRKEKMAIERKKNQKERMTDKHLEQKAYREYKKARRSKLYAKKT